MEIKDIDKVIRRAINEYEANGLSLTFVTIHETVLQSKNPKYMYKFVKYVKGANVERFVAAIKKTKNQEYIDKVEHLINEADAQQIG